MLSILRSATPDGLAPLTFDGALTFIFVFSSIGLLWAAWNWFSLTRISLVEDYTAINSNSRENLDSSNAISDISDKISQGAK